ncbi:HAD family phosphatase [Marispirochaeta aestuarii]|uniref:HAD family hydrolase n=1 Tax=Marispirochaeta aestuarii TaxID=1963862 RepID=UPI0029C778F3|nr:HAD family phosphatase [Marispirochaeta aestuarii]
MKAVIFDLDGVLVDSEPFHAETLVALAGDLGISLSREETRRFIGVSDEEMWETLISENRLTGHPGAKNMAKLQAARTLERLSSRALLPRDGVSELLVELRSLGILTAVASSSARAYVDHVLETAGFSLYFPVRVAGDEVDRCKPDPEPYRRATELLGVPLRSAAAIEDSPSGIESARRAGLFCIGLETAESWNTPAFEPDLKITGFSRKERRRILRFLDLQ